MSINLILFLFSATAAFLIFQALTLRLRDRLGRLGVDDDKQALRLALLLAVLRFARWLSLVAALTAAFTFATVFVVHLAGSPDIAVEIFNQLGEWRRDLGSVGAVYGWIVFGTLAFLLAVDLFYERRRIRAKARTFMEEKRQHQTEIEKLSASYMQPGWEYIPSSPEMDRINAELTRLQAEIRERQTANNSAETDRELQTLEERRRALLEIYRNADIERRIAASPPSPEQVPAPSRAEQFWGFFLSKGFLEGLGGLSRLMALASMILLVPATVGILDTKGALPAPFWRTQLELTAKRLATGMAALGPKSELREEEQERVAEIAHSIAEILWIRDLQSSGPPPQGREEDDSLVTYAARAAAVRSYLNSSYRNENSRRPPGPGPSGYEAPEADSPSPAPKPPGSPGGGLLRFILEERARRDSSFRAGLPQWSTKLKSQLRELRQRATPAERFEAALLQGVQNVMGGEGATLLELLWGSRDFQSVKERFLNHIFRSGLEREELLAEELARGKDLGTALQAAEAHPVTSEIREVLHKVKDQRSSLLGQAAERRGRTGRALPDPIEPVLAEVAPAVHRVGKTLDGAAQRSLMTTIARYSDVFPGDPPARSSEYRIWMAEGGTGVDETLLQKRGEIAHSFVQLQGYEHLGGILIGAPPQPGPPKLNITDFAWSEHRDGVRLLLVSNSGQPLLSEPFDRNLIRQALLYAADGRVATVSIFPSAGLAAQRVLLHPALVGSETGQDAIRTDQIIFEYLDEQDVLYQFGDCGKTKLDGSILSEVREKEFHATLEGLQIAPRPRPDEVLEFFVKKVEPPQGSEIDPEPCLYSEDLTAIVRRGLQEHPTDAAAMERMTRFVVLQRLFRLALNGDLGSGFPVEKLLLLRQDLGADVPLRATPGWLPAEYSSLDSLQLSAENYRVLAEARKKMLLAAMVN